MDAILNAAFFIFHTLWIAFNCLGWASKRTRPWHLLTIVLTIASWFGLGYWYGWGYCPCTEWHWRVRERLGYNDPPSYIQLLIRELTGIELRVGVANTLAVSVLAVATVLGIAFGVRDLRRQRALSTPAAGGSGLAAPRGRGR